MRSQYPSISLFCAALCVVAGLVAGQQQNIITDERVQNTVIQQTVSKESIADVSAPFRLQSNDLSQVLSGIQFDSPQLNLLAVDLLENHSCEAEASTFGHEHACEVAAHEIFCEMSKLVVYVSISTQNLEVNAGPLSNATDEAASIVQMISNGALPEIIEVSGATFEDFINNPENIINLVDALKRSVPTSGIIRSATRLAIAINKFIDHARNLLVYLGVPDLVDFFRQVAQRLATVPGTVADFFFENVLHPAANALIETITWFLMVQNNFPNYIRQVFYKYLTAAEEIVDIIRASYNGYSASGFSQIIVKTIVSRNATTGMIPQANELTLPTADTGSTQTDLSKLVSDVTRTVTEDNQPWLIPAITKYSITLLRPGVSNSRVIDVSIPDVNAGDIGLSSGESSPISSSGIAEAPENGLTSYSSPLISPPTISSGNNVVQYSSISVQSKDNTLSIPDQPDSSSLVPQPIGTVQSESSVSKISASSSSLSMADKTVVASDQTYSGSPLAPSKISASSSSVSMTDETIVASGQSNPINYPAPSKISESSSSLSMTDKTVVASDQTYGSPLAPSKISASSSSVSMTDETVVASGQSNPINYPVPTEISGSSSSLSMTDETVVASGQTNPINYPAPSKISESSSSLSMTGKTIVASGQPNPIPPTIPESSPGLSIADETVVASDQSSVLNSNSLDSSSSLTSGGNVVSETVETSKSDNSFSRIIDSYLPRGNSRTVGGTFNLGSLSSISSPRINAPTCGRSTFLSSLSNLNNILNNITSSPFYVPLQEIASALNNVSLLPGDVIVIFLRNNLGMIGRIDGSIQISFRVYRLRSILTSIQQGINIWHMRSREFPSCERRIRSLFQNY